MGDQSKQKLAKEIRQIVKSLNSKITEAHRHQIVVIISQESGIYSKLSGKPELVSVEIREEHVL
jgi:hypothetical protein